MAAISDLAMVDFAFDLARQRSNQSLQPTALWRCASMPILISLFSVGATPRPQSGGWAPSRWYGCGSVNEQSESMASVSIALL